MTDDRPEPTSAGPGTTRLRRALAIGALAGLAVAAATGIWLWSGYYPTPPGMDPAHLVPAAGNSARMQDWHVTASAAATVLGGLWVALTLSRVLATPGGDRGPGGLLVSLATSVVLLVGTVAAWLTGPMLAWQQIALWSVTVGTEVGGLELGTDQVRFYVVDGEQVAPGDFRSTALLHALAIPVVVVLAGTGLAVSARRRHRTDAHAPHGSVGRPPSSEP